MATYQAQIYVTLRPSVLDPAGTAVQSGLAHMGYNQVSQVRIGKYVEVTLSAADEAQARQQLDQICDQLLANPVIENYRFDLACVDPQAQAVAVGMGAGLAK
ncbi:MAG: phosphoribosylformylglycinamidine synthase subunit PurS [Leptolyngbya sp. RL_3_1]|nr:phosphoribosylformylglycinamidine synthase subunit PurS [Leptolyngbya sp. RL_3_1]